MRFVDIAAASGLDFRHTNGASPERYFPETMSGGGMLFDANGDGRLDIYLLDGHHLTDPSVAQGHNRLYLAGADGSFDDQTEPMGVGDTGYGFGGVAADFDGDMDNDLYVTNYGADVLYRNEGDRFRNVSSTAIPYLSAWSTSCAVLDYDGDGDLDLYVAHYVDYDIVRDRDADMPYLSMSDAVRLSGGVKGYPHPANFAPEADLLLRNDSGPEHLRFVDVSASAGIPVDGKGLGVVTIDIDADGWIDLYVANDAVPNHLLRNAGHSRFEAIGQMAGVAFGQDGQAEAGMGVDAGDYDGDGFADLTVTNFQGEPNGLYRNDGTGYFQSLSFASGTGLLTVPSLAFGTNFIDVDSDGRLDLFVGNGHVLDNVTAFDQSTTYRQRNLLFLNRGPNQYGNTVFTDITEEAGDGFGIIDVTRGSAVGDIDQDGDSDLLVMNLGGPVSLLRNDTATRNSWISLSLQGQAADAYGASVRLYQGEDVILRSITSGRSYLSQSDPRLLIGTGDSAVDSLVILWPHGPRQRVESPRLNTHHVLVVPQ